MTESYLDILDVCLDALERGDAVETLLNKYPHYADDLRPVLGAAVLARQAALREVPADILRRGKARALRTAAELREARSVSPLLPAGLNISSTIARLAFNSLLVLILLFTAGASVVSASSSAIPGDNLYPTKRAWEALRLVFAFDPMLREMIQVEMAEERIREVESVFQQGREIDLEFIGVVTEQTPASWTVGGFQVVLVSTTLVQDQVSVGDLVFVRGRSQPGDVIVLMEVSLVTQGNPGDSLPTNPPPVSPTLEAQSSSSDASTTSRSSSSQSSSSIIPAGSSSSSDDGSVSSSQDDQSSSSENDDSSSSEDDDDDSSSSEDDD